MRQICTRSTLCILCMMCLFSWEAAARELIIMGVPKEPMRFLDASQKPVGIDVEIVQLVFGKLGIPYKIELIPSSPRLEAFWQSEKPEVDMVLTYSQNEERAKYLLFAKESHIDIAWHFFVLEKNKARFTFNSYADLKGMTIGATTGYAYTPDFWDAGQKGVFKLDESTRDDLQIEKLLSERFDAVPMNTIAALYQAKQKGHGGLISYLPKPLASKAYFNTFVRASNYPDLEALARRYDTVLKELKSEGALKPVFSRYGFK